MSDEQWRIDGEDDEAPKPEGDEASPAEEDGPKGLGLTQEFARLEAEIEGEVGPRKVRFDETDSSEWVAPVVRADETGGENDEWATVGPVEEDDDPATPQPESVAGGAAADASDPPAPVEPTEQPVEPTERPVEPTEQPVEPTEQPVEPTEQPVEPTEPITDPSDDDAAATPPPDSDEAAHDGVPDAPPAPPEPPTEVGIAPVPPAPAVEPPATEHTVVRDRPLAPAAMGPGSRPLTPISEEDIEERTPALWWRFLAGSVTIVASVATAVALSLLLALNGLASDLQTIPGVGNALTEIEPGEPQTILIVGSDKRSNTPGDPGRSDTTMLLRVDPDNNVLSLFSLPRDLKVDIAGAKFGPAKLNEAFTDGGVNKTLKTVQDLTGLKVNHVVNVDFQGFADAVDAIGCVYVDVDRHYFNDNSLAATEADTYAAINVNAGYQRLCGQNALDYVRFRHEDNDFVRAARQQDFLRNARAQVPVREVLPIVGGDTSNKLLDIFTKYTSSDIKDPAQVIAVLKAFIGVKDVPIKEVHFGARDTIENGVSYVEASKKSIKKAVNEFLGDEDSAGGPSNAPQKQKDKAKPESKKKAKKDEAGSSDGSNADLVSIDDSYARFGRTSARRLKKDKLSVYIPQNVAPESLYDGDSRQYDIKDESDEKQPAYKMVIQLTTNVAAGQYYGIEGTTWKDPPILDNPSETRTIDGRDYDLYYDGDRLRIVAFHDKRGNSYWVSNTLLQTLNEDQMLAIAASMKKADG